MMMMMMMTMTTMIRPGYVTNNVYVHCSSDIENISLKFSFTKTLSSIKVLISKVFFLHTSYGGVCWLFFS